MARPAGAKPLIPTPQEQWKDIRSLLAASRGKAAAASATLPAHSSRTFEGVPGAVQTQSLVVRPYAGASLRPQEVRVPARLEPQVRPAGTTRDLVAASDFSSRAALAAISNRVPGHGEGALVAAKLEEDKGSLKLAKRAAEIVASRAAATQVLEIVGAGKQERKEDWQELREALEAPERVAERERLQAQLRAEEEVQKAQEQSYAQARKEAEERRELSRGRQAALMARTDLKVRYTWEGSVTSSHFYFISSRIPLACPCW